MKKLLTTAAAFVLLLGLAACDVEKTGEGEYKVETPTSEELTDSARGAAEATGTALEEAGREIQEHAQPGDQSDSTATTGTTTTGTTTTTTTVTTTQPQ